MAAAAKQSDDLAAFAAARRERMKPPSKCKVCGLPPALVADLRRGRVARAVGILASR